ncbi:alkylglycerol monooxygenase [Nephila pilipes]|uniref:Alkylglycerol monooxygenase n=1 Tax=Nephila pilipes TaxID=299642 RepID=A0A8X6QF72_NEPPI|nr:alkylglycerol monooxygenase [Nephila pilipes]
MEYSPLETLGYLFYAVNPNRTTYVKVEEVPNYIIEVVPWFITFLVVERFFLLLKKKPMRVNDFLGSASQGLMTEISRLVLDGWKFAAYIYIYSHWRIVTLPWDSLWTWFIALIAADFLYYWTHRASHEINLIWAAHQVHHSSEDYTLSTALRQSVLLSQLLWILYLPVALIVPPAPFLVHFQLNFIYQFWLHTELIKSIGPLEYILNTASHHRVHHGRNRYCIDKNYAGFLIIWDRMFGTFEAEKEQVVYGTVSSINTFEPLYIQFGDTVNLLKKAWSANGLRYKLSTIFKGPGWSPGKPWLGDTADIPEIQFPVKKYDPYLPFWCILYSIGHFALVPLVYIELQKYQHFIPPMVLYGAVAYLIFTLTSLGCFLEQRSYAPWLESLRCLLYVVLDYYFISCPMFSILKFEHHMIFLKIIRGLFLVSGIIWLKIFIGNWTIKISSKKLK